MAMAGIKSNLNSTGDKTSPTAFARLFLPILFGSLAGLFLIVFVAVKLQQEKIAALEERYSQSLRMSSPKSRENLLKELSSEGIAVERSGNIATLRFSGEPGAWVALVNRLLGYSFDWTLWRTSEVSGGKIEGVISLRNL